MIGNPPTSDTDTSADTERKLLDPPTETERSTLELAGQQVDLDR